MPSGHPTPAKTHTPASACTAPRTRNSLPPWHSCQTTARTGSWTLSCLLPPTPSGKQRHPCVPQRGTEARKGRVAPGCPRASTRDKQDMWLQSEVSVPSLVGSPTVSVLGNLTKHRYTLVPHRKYPTSGLWSAMAGRRGDDRMEMRKDRSPQEARLTSSLQGEKIGHRGYLRTLFRGPVSGRCVSSCEGSCFAVVGF